MINPHHEVPTPKCPLCHELMKRELRLKHGCFVFACDGKASGKEATADRRGIPAHRPIAIRVDDPFVGKWEAAYDKEKVPCGNPRCPKAPDGQMRVFATRTGYLQGWCPDCGTILTNGEPDRAKNILYSPDNMSPGQKGVA